MSKSRAASAQRNSARTTKEITKDARAFLEHGAPEPDDADATDGERTASPADLNPDLGGGFVASARAAMVRINEA